MAKRKRPSSKKAFDKVKKAPSSLYGDIEISINDLPCLNKPKKEKITTNIDSDVLEALKKIAEKHRVSYTSLLNDALREIFINKKAS